MVFLVQSRIAPLSCCGWIILPLGNWDSELMLQVFRQSFACSVVPIVFRDSCESGRVLISRREQSLSREMETGSVPFNTNQCSACVSYVCIDAYMTQIHIHTCVCVCVCVRARGSAAGLSGKGR